MPEKDKNTLHFQNHRSQMAAPFVIQADFEAVTEKVQGCQPNSTKSYTNKYQKHTGCSYGYKVVCCYDDTNSKPVLVIHARSDANYFKDIYTGYRNIADYNFRLNNLEKVIYKIKGYFWVRSHTAVQYY